MNHLHTKMTTTKMLAFLRDPVAAFEGNPDQQFILHAMFSNPKMARQAWIAISKNPALRNNTEVIKKLDAGVQSIILEHVELANDIDCDVIYQLPTREYFLANLDKHWDMCAISARLPVTLNDVISTNIKWNWLSLFTNPHIFA